MQRDKSSTQWRWLRNGDLIQSDTALDSRVQHKRGGFEEEPPSATSPVTGYNDMWVWMIWVCDIHTHIYIRKDGKRIVFRWLTNIHTWNTWGPLALCWSIGLRALCRSTRYINMRTADILTRQEHNKTRNLTWSPEWAQYDKCRQRPIKIWKK